MFTSSYVDTRASLGEREMCGNTSPKGEYIYLQIGNVFKDKWIRYRDLQERCDVLAMKTHT
jgi:hypothetical protein